MLRVVAIALAQGMVLRLLHHLAEGEFGRWSELVFLLPIYAFTVGVPLTYYLLRSRLGGGALARALAGVGLALATTAAYVGWVNGPVAELRPATEGSVFLYVSLAALGWFVALPFLRLGLRGSLTAVGYAALFDEAWRLAITLAFAAVFVQFFWGLLLLFVGLFQSIHVDWPGDIILRPAFYYPATCAAAGFAIGLTEVRPEMFRGLRHLLLTVLRWLTVLAAGIVLLFLGTLMVEGVAPLWKTHFAAAGLITLSLALITLYNTDYQDGSVGERFPLPLAWLVRAALILGPMLAVLAFWALTLRLEEYGVSEDRLNALVVVTILAGYLGGYCVVAGLGAKAPFDFRHVNVAMALTVIATLLVIHSPLVDFKRIAAASRLGRVAKDGDRFDFRYLRFDLGRHGLIALQALGRSDDPRVAQHAQTGLAEPNRDGVGFLARGRQAPVDRARFLLRIEIYPRGKQLPDDLVEQLLATYRDGRWRLPCIDRGPACVALLIDLNGDGQDEAIVPLIGEGTVYARQASAWAKVGRLQPGHMDDIETLRQSLVGQRLRTLPPATYGGLEIGVNGYPFVPCAPGDPTCPASPR